MIFKRQFNFHFLSGTFFLEFRGPVRPIVPPHRCQALQVATDSSSSSLELDSTTNLYPFLIESWESSMVKSQADAYQSGNPAK